MRRWRELNVRHHLTNFISIKFTAWTESLILEVQSLTSWSSGPFGIIATNRQSPAVSRTLRHASPGAIFATLPMTFSLSTTNSLSRSTSRMPHPSNLLASATDGLENKDIISPNDCTAAARFIPPSLSAPLSQSVSP